MNLCYSFKTNKVALHKDTMFRTTYSLLQIVEKALSKTEQVYLDPIDITKALGLNKNRIHLAKPRMEASEYRINISGKSMYKNVRTHNTTSRALITKTELSQGRILRR